MEQRDELWPDGPCFYYDTALFPPGTDSFALAYFARPARGDTVCDLGSGTGLLGTLLLAREDSLIIENVELSAPAAALARKSFLENGNCYVSCVCDTQQEKCDAAKAAPPPCRSPAASTM